MKHTTIALRTLLALSALAPALALRATPLAHDALVYDYPSTTSTVIGILPAGTEPPRFNGGYILALPVDWREWKVIGYGPSQDCWVRDTDTGFYEIVNAPDKKFYVKTGTLLRAAPNADATVTGTMSTGDTSELRDNQGEWVKVHHMKFGMGFIHTTDIFASDFSTTSTTTPSAVVSTSTLTVTSTSLAQAPISPLKTPSLSIYVTPSKPYFENQPPSTPEMQQLLAGIKTGDTLPPAQLCPIQPQVTTTATAVTTATESPKSE